MYNFALVKCAVGRVHVYAGGSVCIICSVGCLSCVNYLAERW
jgi:hypothetical protein